MSTIEGAVRVVRDDDGYVHPVDYNDGLIEGDAQFLKLLGDVTYWNRGGISGRENDARKILYNYINDYFARQS